MSLRGPVGLDRSGSNSFQDEFVSYVSENYFCPFHAGDLVTHAFMDVVRVMYGQILFVVVEDFPPSNSRASWPWWLQPRLRVRVRVTPPSYGSAGEIPVGRLLVQELEGKEYTRDNFLRNLEDGWIPVKAAKVPGNGGASLRRSYLAEFFVYNAYVSPPTPILEGRLYANFSKCDVLKSPSLFNMWNRQLSRMDDVEGVIFKDMAVPPELSESLTRNIDKFVQSQTTADCHPASRAGDIVDPSMYPYIEGVSGSAAAPSIQSKRNRMCYWLLDRALWRDRFLRWFCETERWGAGKFSWLPANICVSAEGRCKWTSVGCKAVLHSVWQCNRAFCSFVPVPVWLGLALGRVLFFCCSRENA